MINRHIAQNPSKRRIESAKLRDRLFAEVVAPFLTRGFRNPSISGVFDRLSHMKAVRSGIVLLILAGAVLWLAHPVVAALLWGFRISRSVKVDFNYPQCVNGKEDWSRSRCQCELVFDGITTPSEIAFEGSNFHYTYDARHRTFHLTGTGLIRSGTNAANISNTAVVINRTELPANDPSTFHVLIERDGTLKGSRTDIAW